jgi:hypothetical protein
VLDVSRQITIDDAILECERDRRLAEQDGPIELERIGESFEFGWLILELLERAGWLVHVTFAFAGQLDGEGTRGILVIAAHPDVGLPVEVTGRTVADCATPLLIETGKHARTIANAARRRDADRQQRGSVAASAARKSDRRPDADDLSEAAHR